jgi:hypothetical protein
MSRKLPTTEELIGRPVIRHHLDSEWMSKMSSKEFKQWVETEKSTYGICRYPEHEHDAKLQQQIEFKEMEYKMRKEQLLKPIGGVLTQDTVLTPSTRDALIAITGTTKTNKNGRVYDPKIFDLKGIKKSGRLNGVFDHPDTVRWDKYEKHVKKHGIY